TRNEFVPYKAFLFNDHALDKQQLDNLKVGDKGITIIDDQRINYIMDRADVHWDNVIVRWYRAKQNSPYKQKWDFSYSYLMPVLGLKNKIPDGDTRGGFILFGNSPVAYNVNDAGNFLWGQMMKREGFGLFNAQEAANINSVKAGDGWDSPEDQR